MRKSKNHGMFIGEFEYFTYGNSVYRANKSNTIDINTGFRTGERFECFLRDWELRKAILLADNK